MSARKLNVTLTEVEMAALLALIPACHQCGGRAEILLNSRTICVPCAARVRHGVAETPAWSWAADKLQLALSSFEVQA